MRYCRVEEKEEMWTVGQKNGQDLGDKQMKCELCFVGQLMDGRDVGGV